MKAEKQQILEVTNNYKRYNKPKRDNGWMIEKWNKQIEPPKKNKFTMKEEAKEMIKIIITPIIINDGSKWMLFTNKMIGSKTHYLNGRLNAKKGN